MTTWKTVYEQLQEILIECLELWWKPMWHEWNWDEYEIYCNEWNSPFIDFVSQWLLCFSISYHDLFSKDSGLIEFVEWEPNEHIENITINEYWWFKYDVKRSPYYEIADMTAEEKVKFFVNNAIIPTK